MTENLIKMLLVSKGERIKIVSKFVLRITNQKSIAFDKVA